VISACRLFVLRYVAASIAVPSRRGSCAACHRPRSQTERQCLPPIMVSILRTTPPAFGHRVALQTYLSASPSPIMISATFLPRTASTAQSRP
jgi:hypothetical protein